MKGVILAAGNGMRLRNIVNGSKCLLPVDGTSLVRRQINALRECGVSEIVVVVGFDKERVQTECGPGIQFVENERYHETNSLYSLWLARSHLADGFVVLNSDVLFHPAMLQELLSDGHDAALLMADRRPGDLPLGPEEMKVRVDGAVVTDISKDIAPHEADGENVGIVRFGPRQAPRIVHYLNELVASGSERDWAPRAFQQFARQHRLVAVRTGDYPWIEIDFPEDYVRAEREIAPRLTSQHDAR